MGVVAAVEEEEVVVEVEERVVLGTAPDQGMDTGRGQGLAPGLVVEEVVEVEEVVVEVAEEVAMEVLGMEVDRGMVMDRVGVEEEIMSSLKLRNDFALYDII